MVQTIIFSFVHCFRLRYNFYFILTCILFPFFFFCFHFLFGNDWSSSSPISLARNILSPCSSDKKIKNKSPTSRKILRRKWRPRNLVRFGTRIHSLQLGRTHPSWLARGWYAQPWTGPVLLRCGPRKLFWTCRHWLRVQGLLVCWNRNQWCQRRSYAWTARISRCVNSVLNNNHADRRSYFYVFTFHRFQRRNFNKYFSLLSNLFKSLTLCFPILFL